MSLFSKPQSLVTFIVGKGHKEQTYVVHKSFAVFHSPVFAAAFNGNNGHIEVKSQTMQLPDHDPAAFGKLVHWLYTQVIEDNDADFEASYGIVNFCNIWSLASYFKIIELQNAVMPRIIEHLKFGDLKQVLSFLPIAYDKSNLYSPLRSLAVHKVAWDMEPKTMYQLKVFSENKGFAWFDMLWVDVAIAFSKQYWDSIPGKYFREWGVLEDYLVIKSEDKDADVLE
jgi:hypothetical protein